MGRRVRLFSEAHALLKLRNWNTCRIFNAVLALSRSYGTRSFGRLTKQGTS